MKQASWKRKIGIGAAAACVLCIVAAMLAPQLALRALAATVLRAYGYDLAYDNLNISLDALHGTNVRIATLAGEPVVRLNEVRATYALPFSLKSFDLESPQFTLIRHRDGSWN